MEEKKKEVLWASEFSYTLCFYLLLSSYVALAYKRKNYLALSNLITCSTSFYVYFISDYWDDMVGYWTLSWTNFQ